MSQCIHLSYPNVIDFVKQTFIDWWIVIACMIDFLVQRNPEITHMLNNPDLMRQVRCSHLNLKSIMT